MSEGKKTTIYIGNENIVVDGTKSELTVNDFWRWAYSDLSESLNLGAFAEFLVASALDVIRLESEKTRVQFRAFDIGFNGKGVEVKSSRHTKKNGGKPEKLILRIAPAMLPAEDGDYKLGAERQRNSDVYVFCIYTSVENENPLDMAFWDFYVLSTKTINEIAGLERKTISLKALLAMDPAKATYGTLKEAVESELCRG